MFQCLSHACSRNIHINMCIQRYRYTYIHAYIHTYIRLFLAGNTPSPSCAHASKGTLDWLMPGRESSCLMIPNVVFSFTCLQPTQHSSTALATNTNPKPASKHIGCWDSRGNPKLTHPKSALASPVKYFCGDFGVWRNGAFCGCALLHGTASAQQVCEFPTCSSYKQLTSTVIAEFAEFGAVVFKRHARQVGGCTS